MRTAPEVLQGVVDVFCTGDVSQLDDLIDDAYVDHAELDEETVLGPAGFGRLVAETRDRVRDLDVEIIDLFAADDRAVARLRWRGETPDGPVDCETIDILRVVGGLAAEHWGAIGPGCAHAAASDGHELRDVEAAA